MTLSDVLRVGQKASELLNNEAYKLALEATKEAYINEWQHTKFKDSEAREMAYIAVRVLADVDAKLQSYVTTAEYERQIAESKISKQG